MKQSRVIAKDFPDANLDWLVQAAGASLALDARLRSDAALAGEPYEALTAAELGGPWTSQIQVHMAIKQARIELFGKDLSNSAIFYRLKKRRERESRTCAEPGCSIPLPRLAHGSKRYCRMHGSGRARIERHRRQYSGNRV
jgi:hypothetical protein